MCEHKFDEDALDMLYKISKLNPFKLLQYLEEAHCYAVANVDSRNKAIQNEMRHLWKDDKVCVSSSQKYIKHMKKEVKIFEERAETLSHIIKKVKSGEFVDGEDE